MFCAAILLYATFFLNILVCVIFFLNFSVHDFFNVSMKVIFCRILEIHNCCIYIMFFSTWIFIGLYGGRQSKGIGIVLFGGPNAVSMARSLCAISGIVLSGRALRISPDSKYHGEVKSVGMFCVVFWLCVFILKIFIEII